MEALVLVGGFVLAGIAGYWVINRLCRFLDAGGISPYWDAEEEQAAKRGAAASAAPTKARSPASPAGIGGKTT